MDDKNQQPTSLKTCTWRQIDIGSAEWLVKAFFSEDFYEVMFSDLITIWHERLSSSDIRNRSKEINASLEIEFNKLLAHVADGLNGRHTEVIYIKSSSKMHTMTVTMKLKLAGLPVEWQFHTSCLTPDVVREHLTCPLMAMVFELSRQKNELFGLLKEKDLEIADFRSQGAKVSRKKLETAVFDEASFNDSMARSKAFGGSGQPKSMVVFNDEGQQLYQRIMRKMCGENFTCSDMIDMMTNDKGRPGNVTVGASSSLSNTTPTKSPPKRPAQQTPETELQRRQALEQKLAEDEKKECAKKKKVPTATLR